MNITFPTERKPLYGMKFQANGAVKQKLIGYELWATNFANMDGVDRNLLDPKSPWRKLWEIAYKDQSYDKDINLDVFWIEKSMQEYIGIWDGFYTSFEWQGIKFVNVYVQLVLGQRYFLPKVLIEQIKDKVDAKSSKIDAHKDLENTSVGIKWEKPTDSSRDYFQGALDNFGRLN